MVGTSRGDFAVSVTRFGHVLLIAIAVSASRPGSFADPVGTVTDRCYSNTRPRRPPEPPRRITGLVLDSRDAPVSDAGAHLLYLSRTSHRDE